MSLSHSSKICLTCDRRLPRAASRCPWCKAPILVRAASGVRHGHGMAVFSRRGEGRRR